MERGDAGDGRARLATHDGIFDDSIDITFIEVDRYHVDGDLHASSHGTSRVSRVNGMLKNVYRIQNKIS
jgi:hypothetical protein